MAEIQKYALSIGQCDTGLSANGDYVRVLPDDEGRWVYYSAHLADKKAALAAQAEEHVTELAENSRLYCQEVANLKLQHAQELTDARGEGEASERSLMRRVHRRIEICIDAGCEHICVRCGETWPCETAVIAGLG